MVSLDFVAGVASPRGHRPDPQRVPGVLGSGVGAGAGDGAGVSGDGLGVHAGPVRALPRHGHLTVFVPGNPRPQGSKVGIVRSAGGVAMRESAKGLKKWRDDVALLAKAEMRGQAPATGPVWLHLLFELPRPGGKDHLDHDDPHLRPPDLDKLTRAIGDALTGVVYVDDSQVIELMPKKQYAAPRGPGVFVEAYWEDR